MRLFKCAAVLLIATQTWQCTQPSMPHRQSQGALYLPEKGKTWLFIGQDSDSIANYQRDVPEDPLEGVTLYTALKSNDPNESLKGLFSTANWGAGNIDIQRTLNEAPRTALAIGLAFDQCQDPSHSQQIVLGHYDRTLHALIKSLKDLAPRPIFLRIGYEFDGPWNCYQPDNYKQAFRHIAKIINYHQAHNIVTVWQSAVWPDAAIAGENQYLYDHQNSNLLEQWYPGDDVVDWIGLSVFYRDLSQWHYQPPITPQQAQDNLLDFARKRKKPVFIAEAAPQGYSLSKLTQSPIQINQQKTVSANDIWQQWYQPLFDYIDQNRDIIRALAYINADWASQPMWHCEPNTKAGSENCSSGYWGDTRVQANSEIKACWLNEVTNPKKWQQLSN